MSRTRVFTKMVAADAKYQPAVRIVFKGKYQSDYFSLKKIAEEDFDTNQTDLGRKILCDWLNQYREHKKNGDTKKSQQMVLILRDGRKKLLSKKGAENVG